MHVQERKPGSIKRGKSGLDATSQEGDKEEMLRLGAAERGRGAQSWYVVSLLM